MSAVETSLMVCQQSWPLKGLCDSRNSLALANGREQALCMKFSYTNFISTVGLFMSNCA